MYSHLLCGDSQHQQKLMEAFVTAVILSSEPFFVFFFNFFFYPTDICLYFHGLLHLSVVSSTRIMCTHLNWLTLYAAPLQIQCVVCQVLLCKINNWKYAAAVRFVYLLVCSSRLSHSSMLAAPPPLPLPPFPLPPPPPHLHSSLHR